MKKLNLQENDVLNKWFMENVPDKQAVKLHISELCVDEEYQRVLKQAQVNAIVKNFNWFVVNPIKVVKRDDGKYYIFDGQHTAKAIEKYTGTSDTLVDCVLYKNLPYEVEVALFSFQTGISRGLSPRDKFKADLKREAQYAVDIQSVLDTNDIPVVAGGGDKRGIQIGDWLFSLYYDLGKAGLQELLLFVKECWECRFVGTMVKGLSAVFLEYGDEIDKKKLQRLLKELGFKALKDDAEDLANRQKCLVPKAVTYKIIDEYCMRYKIDLPRYALK